MEARIWLVLLDGWALQRWRMHVDKPAFVYTPPVYSERGTRAAGGDLSIREVRVSAIVTHS